jgi:phosphoglycolate phosphatase-like HAD superfamily hydrolase
MLSFDTWRVGDVEHPSGLVCSAQVPSKPRISLLVTDLDNTLWDWFEIWYASFSALLNGIVSISGIPQEELEPEIRKIHQARGTSEYSYLIGELPALNDLHGPDANLQEIYKDAIEAAREARRRVRRLYPGVLETLKLISAEGTTIAGYTESLAFVTSARVKKLGLDGVLDFLYSPEDHDFPEGVSPQDLRTLNDEAYELEHTEHRHTPQGHLKPSPAVLEAMISELQGSADVAYVGDSLMKDIAMAQTVGALDVWAKYGLVQHRPEYALLQRVSHWTDEDVEREKQIAQQPEVAPTIVLEHSFSEILGRPYACLASASARRAKVHQAAPRIHPDERSASARIRPGWADGHSASHA